VPRSLKPLSLALVMVTTMGLTAAQAAEPAGGQVFRCGQSYQQVPCEGGKPVDVDDGRDAAQQRQAQAAAAGDRRLAEQLAAERRARETAERRPGGAAAIALPAQAKASQPLPDCTEPAGHAKAGHANKKKARKDCLSAPVYLAPKPVK
jgi:hypothetical protein